MVAFTHVGNANANAASVTTALSANVPSGALIVIHTHETHIGTGAVTDTKGNTYHLAGVGTYVTGNVAI